MSVFHSSRARLLTLMFALFLLAPGFPARLPLGAMLVSAQTNPSYLIPCDINKSGNWNTVRLKRGFSDQQLLDNINTVGKQSHAPEGPAVDFNDAPGNLGPRPYGICESKIVRTARDGTVIRNDKDGAGATRLWVKHDDGQISEYVHMLWPVNLVVGTWYPIGTVVGTMSCNGHCTGIHVHFDVLNSSGARINNWQFTTEFPSVLRNGFKLVSVNSGKCLDVSGASSGNGANVQQWECLSAAQTNQVWMLIPMGDAFQLVAQHSDKCLDVSGVSTADGANIHQWQCIGASQTNQLWTLSRSGGTYQVLAKHTGKCLDVAGASTSNGGNVHQWSCHGGTNQQWRLMPVGSFQITAVHSGKCVDVSGAGLTSGTNIHQWSCFGGANQRWRLLPAGDAYEVTPVHANGRCLDISGVSIDNGANAQQWQCIGLQQNNQLWQLTQFTSSFFLIVKHSGKCLDVSGVSTADGANIHQWQCRFGQNNQLWRFRQ